MNYFWRYLTPTQFDDIILRSDGEFLTGLSFDTENIINSFKQQPVFPKHTRPKLAPPVRDYLTSTAKLLPIFQETCIWLDSYFSGKTPNFTPKHRLYGVTPFREEVKAMLLAIPYGETTTYGALANKIATAHGVKKMSARAVGNAVGWNPICIIIPCHRVLGSNDQITGYSYGIKNKIALLKHEQKLFCRKSPT